MATAAREAPRRIVVGPNSVHQTMALASEAQVLVVGGQAGGGKSRYMLMDPLRYIYPHAGCQRVQNFSGVIFRRTLPQITNEGGLWDESQAFYSELPGAVPVPGNLEWRWPKDRWDKGPFPTMRMTHLVHEETVYNWQGAQIPWLGLDEGTHFSGKQFWYMLSRNRSMTGVVGHMRVSCNPDPDSFLADLVDWYIDDRESIIVHGREVPNPNWGLPLGEREGVIRYFFKEGEEIHWAFTRQDLYKFLPKTLPQGVSVDDLIKSFSFVPFKITDNVDLLRTNPQYLANLYAQEEVERARLLYGNWRVRPKAGKVLPRTAVEVIPAIPAGAIARVRYWDKAATDWKDNPDADYTVGVRASIYDDGTFVVEDVVREQVGTAAREALMRQVATQDGDEVDIVLEVEPGSGGKDSGYQSVTNLRGYTVILDRPTQNLLLRAKPLASQWQVGNVKIVGPHPWNGPFLTETNGFDGSPSTATRKDDQVAATAGAFNMLMKLEDVDADNVDVLQQ